MRQWVRISPFTVVLFSVVSLNIISSFVTFTKILGGQHFSYRERDYPELYTPSRPSPVAMVAEESVNYDLTLPESNEQWATSQVDGGGYIRLGDAKRSFAVTMFHELHCMRLMRFALSGQYSDFARGHLQHCLNYLRQEILCASDVTLEPGNILERDYEIERVGSVHVCNNWESLFEDAEANWADWSREGGGVVSKVTSQK